MGLWTEYRSFEPHGLKLVEPEKIPVILYLKFNVFEK